MKALSCSSSLRKKKKKDLCPVDANVLGVFNHFFMYIYKMERLDKSGL